MFRTATQLNLNELPRFLYLTRWCKDPDDTILARKFCEFYNVSNDTVIINKNSQIAIEEDYQYLLKRTLCHLQRFIKAKPENAKHFYETISTELEKKISLNNDENNSNNEDTIKNPRNIKPKGRPPKNRISSSLETSNNTSNKRKKHVLSEHKVTGMFFFI